MKKINYIYLYLIFVLFVTGCSNTSVNKDKKHDNVNSNNKYIIEYSSERNDYNSECFVGCGMKDGKQMYIFQNMPKRFDFFDDEIESYGDNGFNYGLAYYEYNDGAFKMYKVISDDDVLKSNNIKWRYYDKINNKYFIYVEKVGSESQNYFYIFDIDSENDYNICLDCINQAEINYNLDMKALSDNIQMIDEYNFNDGLLDVYCKTENGILNIFRIDISKKELIKIKAIESGNVEYFKDYIVYVKEGHHYIIDKKTLENESDLSKFNREYADNVKWSYCGKKTGFVQGNNKEEAYILSVDGIEKIDIAKEKVDKLECTNGKSFRKACLIEDIMYAVTVDSLYIINVKEDRIIEVYEFEQKPMDITDFHMFSNHKGYIIGKFEKNGYGYNRVLWISRDKF